MVSFRNQGGGNLESCQYTLWSKQTECWKVLKSVALRAKPLCLSVYSGFNGHLSKREKAMRRIWFQILVYSSKWYMRTKLNTVKYKSGPWQTLNAKSQKGNDFLSTRNHLVSHVVQRPPPRDFYIRYPCNFLS